jgi:hypothetical protein
VDGEFEVMQGTIMQGTNMLLDVSDVLSVNNVGNNDISSGKYTDDNGPQAPPFTETDYQLATFTYDSTSIGGTTKFTLSGLGVSTTTDSPVNPVTGAFTETDSAAIQSGTGEGVTPNGDDMVVTGTISARGSAKLSD